MTQTAGKLAVGMSVFALVVTIYSLSELHTISVQHAEQERQFMQSQQSGGSTETPKVTGGAIRKSLETGSSGTQQQIASLPPRVQQLQQQHQNLQKDAGKPKGSGSGSGSKCFFYKNTELWGDVVVWGNSNLKDSAEACCEQCRNHKARGADDVSCNVFVWCGDQAQCGPSYKQCWLKHLAHPEASRPARDGPLVPWTSGTIDVDIQADPEAKITVSNAKERKFHIVTSAQGSAVHWQARVHYYWYKKQKAKCEAEGPCEMGGFTRLLHSGEADDLVDEIPTMVVDPLPQDMVEHSWYVVLNRPYAFVQWCKKAKIPEKYVLMSEPDHVFLRPLPNFMAGETPAAFPFFYIEPGKPENRKITQKYTGPLTRQQFDELAPIGNSPTYMSWDDMCRTMPIWMNTSIAIFKDPESNKAWGWVQEMYGFTIAAWLAGIKKFDLYLNMMSQPPWDTRLNMTDKKPYYILHYTYGMDYKLTGEFTPGKYGEWRFDKRSYGGRPIPRNLGPPPANMKNDLVRFLINAFNEATDAIPCWPEYEKTGKVPKTCDEPPKHFLLEELQAKQRQQAIHGDSGAVKHR